MIANLSFDLFLQCCEKLQSKFPLAAKEMSNIHAYFKVLCYKAEAVSLTSSSCIESLSVTVHSFMYRKSVKTNMNWVRNLSSKLENCWIHSIQRQASCTQYGDVVKPLHIHPSSVGLLGYALLQFWSG